MNHNDKVVSTARRLERTAGRLTPPDSVLTRAPRARFLHRYGAFAASIRFAPFDE